MRGMGVRYWTRVVLPALVVVAACTLAAGLLVDGAAALSALAGGLGVVVLLGSTPAVLGPVATAMPGLSLAAAISFYLTKVGVLAAALVAVTADDVRSGIDAQALGMAVIATTLAWTFLLVVATLRSRQPVYDLPVTSATSPDNLDSQ